MKKSMLLLSVIASCGVPAGALAQFDYATLPSEAWTVEIPDNTLPSEAAYAELMALAPDPTSAQDKLKELRANPPGTYGDAQKTVPLGRASWLMALVALLTYALFKTSKRRLREFIIGASETKKSPSTEGNGWKNKSFFIFSLFILCAMSARAQAPVAVPDNYFLVAGTNYSLDVLKNDNLGACTSAPENVLLEIVSTVPATAYPAPSTQLQNLSVLASNRIRFRSVASFYGQIQITYRITCNGVQSTSTAYVNVGDKPDFISEAECTTSPDAFNWSIKRKGTTANIADIEPPLVGDILKADGTPGTDGIPEIVTGVLGTHTINYSPALSLTSPHLGTDFYTYIVFDNTLAVKKAFRAAGGTQGGCGYGRGIADVDGDGICEIIHVVSSSSTVNTGKILAYHGDGTLVWVSSDTWYDPSITRTSGQWNHLGIAIADIDGDGKVEIMACDRIFAGESGKLLLTLPATSGRVDYGQQGGATTGYNYYGSVFGDVNGDGKMEAVCGNCTYTLSITNRNGTSGNTANLLAKAVTAVPGGVSSLCDIDGDGKLDVICVYEGKMYAWQGHTSAQIGNDVGTGTSVGSRAFAGDVDGDGKPEIAFTNVDVTPSSMPGLYCVKYNSSSNTFTNLFHVTTSDNSGRTTLSMFDFNLDGEMELVYHDETHLRIIDKTGTDKMTFNTGHTTSSEYPTIADLDGDGHAEILCTEVDYLPFTSKPAADGYHVGVYTSNTTVNNWAPARKVWNLHGYNPTYINEDMSVPAHPLPMTAKVRKENGTIYTPYNNYLQQYGPLNVQGEALELATDLTFQSGLMQKMFYNSIADRMEVTAYITNIGSFTYSGPVIMRLFTYDNATSQYQQWASQTFASEVLAVGDNKTYTFNLNSFSTLTLPTDRTWYLVINLSPNGTSAPAIPTTLGGASNPQKECNWTNNMTSRLSYTSGYVILCQNETATLKIDPANAYTLKWLKDDGTTPHLGADGTDANNIGDEKTVKKLTGADSEFLLIDVWTKNGLAQISNPNVPDTVFIYQAPDTLVWNGKQDTDWNNPNNWFDPTDLDPANQWRKIPRGCTNVLIPEKDTLGVRLTRYPDLTEGVSDYGSGSQYFDVRCNNIHIEHGAEVFRSDKLIYSQAYVQVTMASNRWYCFAPPLRDFYTGDIYLNNPKPMDDNLWVFTRLFSQSDPQRGTYTEGNWSSPFNTPNQSFHTGQGLGVWLDDWDNDGSHHQDLTVWYPKNDANYSIWNMDGTVNSGPYATSRTNSHRFAFEESIVSATGAVPLYPEATSAGKAILVGNPFMAHLDWEKFYDANSTKIENYYRLLNADGSIGSYTYGGVSTGSPALTKLIAPMQSFIVTPKVSFASNTLTANSGMTQVSASTRLRASKAAQDAQAAPEHLLVSLAGSVPNTINYAALVRDEEANATTAYNPLTDVMKMFSNGSFDPLHVYFLTQDGLYMDVKTISSLDNTVVRIGFSTTQTGTLTLGVEKLWAFADEDHVGSYFYDVYLYDRKLNVTVDLRRESWLYTFEKTADEGEFIDDRFELRFVKKGTAIEEVKAQVKKTVVKKSYFDLSGRPVPEHAAKGLLLQKSVYSDGTTGYGKVFVR